MEEKQLGMTWLKIYTVLFIIKMLGTTVSAISTYIACAEYSLFTDVIGLTALLLVTVETAYLIFTFIHFSRRTALGYTLNMVYIFLDIFISALNTSFSRSMDPNTNIGHVWGIMIATALLLLVWSLPNYIYFKKRKFLFSGSLKGNENHRPELMLPPKQTSLQEASIGTSVAEIGDRAKQPVSEEAKPKSNAIQVDVLKTLKELHDDGVITDDEFTEKKKQVLGL